MKHVFSVVTVALIIALILISGCISDAEARDGYGSFFERSTGTKHTFILENGGKNGYYFKQSAEDLERIRKNRSTKSFQDLINNQKNRTKKASVEPKKSPTTFEPVKDQRQPKTSDKPMSSFEKALRGWR